MILPFRKRSIDDAMAIQVGSCSDGSFGYAKKGGLLFKNVKLVWFKNMQHSCNVTGWRSLCALAFWVEMPIVFVGSSSSWNLWCLRAQPASSLYWCQVSGLPWWKCFVWGLVSMFLLHPWLLLRRESDPRNVYESEFESLLETHPLILVPMMMTIRLGQEYLLLHHQ